MKAVIMAGGEGMRLRPFTYVLPKPLLPVGDISPIEYSIRYLKNNGFKEIIISTNYLKEKFNICYKFAEEYGIKLHLIDEDVKLGTAGSLDLMREYLTEPFVVLNGDLLAQPPYKAMFQTMNDGNADILIGVKKHFTQIPYGTITFDAENNLLEIYEKPKIEHWINSGIYLLDPRVLNYIEHQTYLDMPSLIERVESNGKVKVHDIGENWLDIGKVEDYESASLVLHSWVDIHS